MYLSNKVNYKNKNPLFKGILHSSPFLFADKLQTVVLIVLTWQTGRSFDQGNCQIITKNFFTRIR